MNSPLKKQDQNNFTLRKAGKFHQSNLPLQKYTLVASQLDNPQARLSETAYEAVTVCIQWYKGRGDGRGNRYCITQWR